MKNQQVILVKRNLENGLDEFYSIQGLERINKENIFDAIDEVKNCIKNSLSKEEMEKEIKGYEGFYIFKNDGNVDVNKTIPFS